jgi:hypothetical protein
MPIFSDLQTAFGRLLRSVSGNQCSVCFVRRHQSGPELARKLGVSFESLWRNNPHLRDLEQVWGGQVLLVSSQGMHHGPQSKAWENTENDFSLVPWRYRDEDFPTYPAVDDFLDHTWEPPTSHELKPISGTAAREAIWGRFEFVDDSTNDPDGVRITDGWDHNNIGMAPIPELSGLTRGTVQFNKKCHKQLQGLWADWARYGMRRHILVWDGSFNPRYMRKASHTRDHLSNHAWGTAFDINAKWNPLGAMPVPLGQHGSVKDLVEIAHKWGFFWGGHFGSHRWDGMHFEVAKIL